MSKSKSASKGGKSGKVDSLTKVKDAAITKPAQSMKSKSKDLAKQVASKDEKKSKKSKKTKEPTPEPSDSDSDSSASSESSDDSADEKSTKPVNGKANGAKKAVAKDSDSDTASDSDASDAAPKANGKAAKVVATQKDDSSDDSESDSEDEVSKPANGASAAVTATKQDVDDSEDEPTTKVATKLPEVAKKAGSDSDSEGDDEDSDSSDDDEETKESAKPVKRKAEDEDEPTVKKTKTEALDTSRGSNLFIGNLSWNIDEAWLREVFEEFGELSGVRLMTDRATGRSKGFGYVEFVNAEDAAKAHREKQGAELDNRVMNVDFANAKPDNSQRQDNRRKSYGDQVGEPSDTLFLGNLSFDAGQETITEAFQVHGTIMGIRLPTDRETGNPKGFGYVTYASVDEAKVALEAMQGAYIEGRPVRVDFSAPRPQNSDSPARGRGGFGGGFGGRGRGGDRGGRGGRGGFGGRGGRGGGRGASTNRGGFGDFSGRKTSFD